MMVLASGGDCQPVIVDCGWLYCYGLEPLLGIGVTVGLFTGFERQWFGKLDCNTTHKLVYIIDPTDVPRAGETCHIERLCRAETGNAEASGYLLAGIRTVFIGSAGKRRPTAGNVNHLTLGKHFAEILGEPDWPMITQSLLFSSLCSLLHYKYPKIFRFYCLLIGRFRGLLYQGLPEKSPLGGLIGRIGLFSA